MQKVESSSLFSRFPDTWSAATAFTSGGTALSTPLSSES
jgi:hypothetical protein